MINISLLRLHIPRKIEYSYLNNYLNFQNFIKKSIIFGTKPFARSFLNNRTTLFLKDNQEVRDEFTNKTQRIHQSHQC